MESHSTTSQSSNNNFGQLDQRVANLLLPGSVLDTFNMFEIDYTPIPEELVMPEFKHFQPKRLFYKKLPWLSQPENDDKEDEEEEHSKSDKKKKKKKKKKDKKSKKSKTSKKTKKILESLCEEYKKMPIEVFVEDPVKGFRRVKLGHLVDPNNKISFISLIKDLIGKDLTRFAVPAYLCEPLSMLQRTSELWEYRSILNSAIAESCKVARFAKVFSFLYIQYACTVGRNKKPFNPLLGETFEYEDQDFRLISEQVSHHPPISAFHAENEEYLVWGHIKFHSKLSGISLDITTEGTFSANTKGPSTCT